MTRSPDSLIVAARAVHVGVGLDGESPPAEGAGPEAPRAAGPATAVLIRHGRVAAVGDVGSLERRAPEARRLDLPELTVTPGLTDAHVHLVAWALARGQADLRGAGSPAEAAAVVAAHVRDRGPGPGGWIRGRGWDPNPWSEPPHRRLLDEALGDRPVALDSHDMHSCWVSSAALRQAGVGAGTPDPDGGRIERDPEGQPTGVLRDNAIPLVTDAAPRPSEPERREALLGAQAALHRLGVTGVHNVEPDALSLLEAVREAGRLRLRVLQHLPLDRLDDAIRIGLRSGFGGPWIRIGGVKVFLDGALGSRTAWLREPYEGTDSIGLCTLEPEAFRDAARRGAAAGLAMTVHAIGDAAVALALETLSDPDRAVDGPVPHRIEHAQLMPSEWLAPRSPPSGVVLSVQPSHLMTDWRAADRVWGDRARRAFALRSMEAAGFTLALGSDAPVEP
ncbi:MAG: amidohydrolase, partial [Longimicrobiales bacterium]|nr:amidohydrolase [Longimicrobiales bacterium]